MQLLFDDFAGLFAHRGPHLITIGLLALNIGLDRALAGTDDDVHVHRLRLSESPAAAHGLIYSVKSKATILFDSTTILIGFSINQIAINAKYCLILQGRKGGAFFGLHQWAFASALTS